MAAARRALLVPTVPHEPHPRTPFALRRAMTGSVFDEHPGGGEEFGWAWEGGEMLQVLNLSRSDVFDPRTSRLAQLVRVTQRQVIVACIPAYRFRAGGISDAIADVTHVVQATTDVAESAFGYPLPTLVALTAVDELAANERADVIAAAAAAVAPHPLRVTSARTHEGVEELKRELLTRTGLVGGVTPRPGGVRLGTHVAPKPAHATSRCW